MQQRLGYAAVVVARCLLHYRLHDPTQPVFDGAEEAEDLMSDALQAALVPMRGVVLEVFVHWRVCLLISTALENKNTFPKGNVPVSLPQR